MGKWVMGSERAGEGGVPQGEGGPLWAAPLQSGWVRCSDQLPTETTNTPSCLIKASVGPGTGMGKSGYNQRENTASRAHEHKSYCPGVRFEHYSEEQRT